jgi:4-hydroxy-2-oxoglutarate aldolase
VEESERGDAPDGRDEAAGDPVTGLVGIYAPVCTPFDATEELDLGALRTNMARYADSGLHGYLALGSNGENRSLDESERASVLATVVEGRGHGQVVMAGAAYEAQRQTERFLSVAADVGADCALVLSPGYFRKQLTDEVLYRYFSTLADAAPLPLLLYNAPGFNGIALTAGLVGRLAGHERIVGMKDSASSGIEAFLPYQRPDFAVLAGSADFLLPAMRAGSPGGTLSLADSFPAAALHLFELARGDDAHAADAAQADMLRVNRAISGTYGVAGVKAAMDLAGFVGGWPRRPLLPLSAAQRTALQTTLVAAGLL